MNIYDISKQAGVSIATVSRVLNGSDKVSPSTREKVLQVIEQNSYTPNAFARSLGLNSMHTVGILCADSSDVYLASAIYYLERELRQNSYASMLCCTGYHLEEKKKYLQLLLSRNVDALFFAGSNFVEDTEKNNAYLFEAAGKVPVFILNGYLAGDRIYSVLCDDRLAVNEMTESLFRRGSHAPVYLYRSLSYSGRKKIAGFREACIKNGITDADKRIFASPVSVHETAAFLDALEKEGLSFDACVTSDDELAVGAVKFALSHGRRIPDEFQVTGYNNSLISTCSTPERTTVDNRVEFMCTTAVSLLMQALDGKNIPARTVFSGDIIQRETTNVF